MSDFYDGMAATALGLLAKFGTTITLERRVGKSINPVTGAVVNGLGSNVTTTGLLTPYPDNVIDGVRILKSDRKIILSNEQEPSPTDKPIIDGESWSIVYITTVKPDGATPVVYFAQVRR